MRLAFPSRRALLAAIVVHSVALAACAQERSSEGGTATTPSLREGPWMQMHERFLEQAEKGGIDLLFIGDSITQGWGGNEVWKRYYEPRHAANFGIGGDRTQHVLWRLDHGELEGITPKAAVVMIGTNNLSSNTAEEIAEGIKAIVQTTRSKLPETKVLLLGIFPRGEQADDPNRAKIQTINEMISALDDDDPMVTYLDIGPAFLQEDGTISKDVMPDFLHLSAQGYRLWADAMEPTLWDLMEGEK